ncbi:MAG: sulfite oxidase heme-binding subunit YedZ [Acetobacteraceae bacterium]
MATATTRPRRKRAPWRDRQGRLSWFKAAALAGCAAPGTVVALWLATNNLGSRPLKETLLWIGLWTVRFVMIALAVTPLSQAFDWPKLTVLRRMAGVTACVYAATHLSLYAIDENLRLGLVASEIIHRFYLTIGFVALLGLTALAVTSTDAAVRRMGRGWKRLHRFAYLIGVLALLHYFIQSKANVGGAVFLAGLFAWLMAWRVTPPRWRASLLAYPVLAVVAAFAAAWIEFAWYAIATGIDPWRVLAANETLRFGLRPAHWVGLVTLGIGVLVLGRRLVRPRRGSARAPATAAPGQRA